MNGVKGGRYEREVAKKLSLWLTNGKSKNELIRSVNSGGWLHRETNQVGDLAPNGKRGSEFREVFAVECKNRQEMDYHHYWTKEKPPLIEWWRKHKDECDNIQAVPLLFWKKNYIPELVGFPEKLINLNNIERSLSIKIDSNYVVFVQTDILMEEFNSNDFIKLGRAYLENG